MSPSTRFTPGIKAKFDSKKPVDASRPSTPLSANSTHQPIDTPEPLQTSKNVDTLKTAVTPMTRSAAKRNASAKAAVSPGSTITAKPNSASKLPVLSTPSSVVNLATPTSTNSTSSTESASRRVAHSKTITDAVAALTREFQIPINLSSRERDQKAINEVMSIYLEHGSNWDHQTKIGFAKVLSMVKTTASSEVITSNHTIWRAATSRSGGWNWGYWIAFRTIYGKENLKSRVRDISIKTIQTSFPGTDIWSDMTPAGVTRTKLETPTPEPITQTTSKGKLKSYERKRPHPDTVTEGSTDRRTSLRAKKNCRYTPMSNREFLDLTTPVASSSRERGVLNPPASSVTAQNGEENLRRETAGQSLKSPVLEANANPIAIQSIAANRVPESEVLTKREDDRAVMMANTAINNINVNQNRTGYAIVGAQTETPHSDVQPAEGRAAPVDKAKHESMVEQLKRELSIQVTQQVQNAEMRTRQRIADLPRPNVFVNDCVNQLLIDVLGIKQQLEALEDDNEARNRNAAVYNIPSGLSGDNTLRSLETLGRQVQNCTRDIYQLKTNQPYEEDPILAHIKREQMDASDSGMGGL
ncbi:hypothetical protein B0J13DRAFT_223751 [Dactylonectria estremocensis]|uniref:Uncharacterized protein n=1 Tax=Dactylonectria estremocensis TaxID=1079267 RepID=A0A9P9F7I3_9HYPO|nr:hypothetical protein B0J13DRAFT_223751 [Dactylonectria estremocensis]